ncbi:Signal transduction histidine kinase [Catalinimonas alkaloidigena]|uniref:histidine kinase n=1 Tax=Catalinimonas alkaloidigena TaxID=1075417 RepID=A0A1G8YDE4_9BACT|nr:ATP-binding protein [Catalinimonas alkaloidigena]SDK00060.1 Signal transduction histidine kinase [Catalinimonas alkaloidigena]
MKVKYKLFLALFFLFGVILLLGGVASHYLRWLARDAAAILQDNNRTLTYMRQIEEAVDAIQYRTLSAAVEARDVAPYFRAIATTMEAQRANLTEPGEKALSETLDQHLNQLSALYRTPDSLSLETFRRDVLPVIQQIKARTGSIYLINEQTLIRKNEQAAATAEKVVLYMGLFVSASIVIGLVFMIGLPVYISRPLETFDAAIRQVADGNYQIAIPVGSQDEYGALAASFNTMAAKLNEYEHSTLAKLLKEQKRLNALINQLDEVILGLDENKRVIFVNEHGLKLLHLQRHQLIGRYAPDLATNHPLLNSLIQELMIDFLPFEERRFKPLRVVEDNREKLFAKNVVDVVEKPTGESRKVLMGHVVILTDVTDFAEKDKAKTHFMATLSHELKTPVAAIQMILKLLHNEKSGALSENQRELLDTLAQNNDRIGRMINEILDLSQIESGTIEVLLTEVAVPELVERAVEGVRLFVQEKPLVLRQTLSPHLPTVKVDAHKTVWILNNFLTNAIRYAPAGSVLEVRAEQEGQRVKIAVVDQGRGISYENQKRIFQKFTRLVKTDPTGTGLGLAISKEFIEAMGGNIGVQSREGEGATFWITCPVAGFTKN